MLGPYRDPVILVTDPLPRACVPEGASSRCPRGGSFARRLAACSRAFSSAATLVLLAGNASLVAITWAITSTRVTASEQLALGTSGGPARREPSHRRASMPFHAGTHQPDEIWERARWKAGQDSWLTLAHATIAPGQLSADELLAGGGAVRVAHDRRGLELVELDPRSTPALVGLRRGDVVTAVNGYALRWPDEAWRARDEVTAGRSMVIELLREGRPVALRVDWGTASPPLPPMLLSRP